MTDFVELVERDDRARLLARARASALNVIAPAKAMERSWTLTRGQWKRFRASPDPLTEYREETEQFVASSYNRMRGRSDAYREEVGDYHEWNPPRNLVEWLLKGHPYPR